MVPATIITFPGRPVINKDKKKKTYCCPRESCCGRVVYDFDEVAWEVEFLCLGCARRWVLSEIEIREFLAHKGASRERTLLENRKLRSRAKVG